MYLKLRFFGGMADNYSAARTSQSEPGSSAQTAYLA
jgi:hypothetical protein